MSRGSGRLAEIARRYADFEFTVPPAPAAPIMCEHAEAFQVWTDELCRRALEKGTLVELNQAQLALLHRYFLWRDNVPKRHQTLSGTHGGHVCLFAVFEATYRQLREAELALTPPPLYLPAPPPPAPAQIAGIMLAEHDEGG